MCSPSNFLVLDVVLEWWHILLPDRVVLWEGTNSEDLTQLHDVCDLELLKLEVGVEYTVVELTEEAHRVSSGQVLLLAVIDGDVFHDLWAVLAGLWLGDLAEVAGVGGSGKSIFELREVFALLELLCSSWVQMAQVVEILLSHGLSLGIVHVCSSEGVIDDLKGLPVTLSLQEIVHDINGGVVAVGSDPSVEADQPDFLKHDLNLTCRVIVNHLSDLVDGNSLVVSVLSLLSLEVFSDGVDERSEVFSDWKIDKDILEQSDEVI